jgi:hypothetical protein
MKRVCFMPYLRMKNLVRRDVKCVYKFLNELLFRVLKNINMKRRKAFSIHVSKHRQKPHVTWSDSHDKLSAETS